MATRSKDQNTLAEGSWNTICDGCGFKFKKEDLRKRWDGYMMCKEDWETQHPSDFFRGFAEDTSVPFTRNDPQSEAAPDVSSLPTGTFDGSL